jgi:D-glycero-alpha-D-manno-heptose-7-phosphate kinase
MGALAGQMIEAFERRALSDVAELVDEHWEYQRALHPSITTPGIEHVIAVARAAGATGCTALGASGGGCVLAIAPAERAAKVRAAMARVAQPLAFTLDMNGVQVDGA